MWQGIPSTRFLMTGPPCKYMLAYVHCAIVVVVCSSFVSFAVWGKGVASTSESENDNHEAVSKLYFEPVICVAHWIES